MIELTLDRVKKLAQEVIQEAGPDFIYVDRLGHVAGERMAECSYVHADAYEYLRDAKPGCIVGRILHRAGVPLERLAMGDNYLSGDESYSAGQLLDGLSNEIRFPDAASDFLSVLQVRQDAGSTWGDAYDIALSRVI